MPGTPNKKYLFKFWYLFKVSKIPFKKYLSCRHGYYTKVLLVTIHVLYVLFTQEQDNSSAVCPSKSWRGEQASLKRAHSVTTETVATFIFPHTRSRPPLTPAMPTLPEEEEDSPEELDSASSSPSTVS